MATQHATLSHIRLDAGTRVAHPPELPRLVHLDSPALEVMTDFRIVYPVTTTPDVSIDDALELMKVKGVRLLLVVDASDVVVGVITAKDIQGERPVKLAQASRISHAEITVEAIMTPQSEIEVLNLLSVRNVQVGTIVATLRELGRQHALVVEVDPDSRAQTVRGVFSTSQIGRQLGVEAARAVVRDSSFTEITADIR